MTANQVRTVVYKPIVITGLHPVGQSHHPSRVMHEHFLCPSGIGNSKFITPVLDTYLGNLGFEQEWIDQFCLCADEALSNACEFSPSGSVVRCLLTIIEHGVEHFISLFIDNNALPGEPRFPSPNSAYNPEEHFSDVRGRGFAIMQQLADGLVVTVVPESTIQTIIEHDHHHGHTTIRST